MISLINDSKFRPLILFSEKITPTHDIIINPKRMDHVKTLFKHYGAISTVSLMSIKTECIKAKLKYLRKIHISVETFIPAVAGECGLLYHTSCRLTKFRIHDYNSSIAFNEVDELRRVLFNLRRAINDHELIVNEVTSKNNYLRLVVRFLQLQAKYALSTSKYRKIFNDVLIKPWEIYDLCRFECYHNYYKLLWCLIKRLARLMYVTTLR
jgi:hypothetical protein